jgi:Rrf2 family cysteine metabolism transcriptional repressor
MLKFSKKTDYGLIAIRYLAEHDGERSVSTKAIADQCHIPNELLAKILQRLARRGVVQSHNGTHGGYSLAKGLAHITIGEVMEAIEGPFAIASCYRERGQNGCDQLQHCTIRGPLGQVQAEIVGLLRKRTLEEMYDVSAKEGVGA